MQLPERLWLCLGRGQRGGMCLRGAGRRQDTLLLLLWCWVWGVGFRRWSSADIPRFTWVQCKTPAREALCLMPFLQLSQKSDPWSRKWQGVRCVDRPQVTFAAALPS